MLTLKTVFSKETLKLVYENTKKELKVTGEAFTNFIKVYSELTTVWFLKTYKRPEAIALSVVLIASLICSSIAVGANVKGREITVKENQFSESLILGNENTVATSTITKKPVVAKGSTMQKVDIITPTLCAYNMENRELLAQMMYAEEGVFFAIFANDPAANERVHKLAGSVILHRLNNHFGGAQTLADVLYAPGQYDYRTIQRVEQGQNLPPQVYQWAEELLTTGALGPDNLVFQAEFVQGSEVYDHIGNQYFCCR